MPYDPNTTMNTRDAAELLGLKKTQGSQWIILLTKKMGYSRQEANSKYGLMVPPEVIAQVREWREQADQAGLTGRTLSKSIVARIKSYEGPIKPRTRTDRLETAVAQLQGEIAALEEEVGRLRSALTSLTSPVMKQANRKKAGGRR